MSKRRHLWITSIFRSGSTLLTMVFKNHPGVLAAWQPYLFFFKACRNHFVRRVLGEPLDPDFPMGILTLDEAKSPFRRVLETVAFSKGDLEDLVEAVYRDLQAPDGQMNPGMKCRALLGRLDGLLPGTAAEVLEQLLERLAQSLEAAGEDRPNPEKVLCAKEVFNEEFSGALMDCESLQARVIHLLRDPRAVVASRNYGVYARSSGTRYPLMFILRSWQRSVHYARLNAGHSRFLMLRYEDLVQRPELTARNLCGFMGLPFDAAMLDAGSFTDASGRPWKGNSSFAVSAGGEAGAVDRWQKVLSEQEVRMIERFCGEAMTWLGYPLVYQDGGRVEVQAFREWCPDYPEWLEKYRGYWDQGI